MVHVLLAVLQACAVQGDSDDFPIHGYISSGSATGLGSFVHNAACPDFALSQDCIDLLRGKGRCRGDRVDTKTSILHQCFNYGGGGPGERARGLATKAELAKRAE
jgi:hypothetical protein